MKLILGTLWALIRHLSHNDATSRKTERLVQNPKANLDHDDPRRHRATSSLSTQSEVYVPQPVQPSTITEPLEEKHHESVVSETNLNAEKKGSEIEENEVVEVSEQKEDKVEDDFTNSESETDDNSPKEINETIDEVSNAKEDSVTDANDEDSEFPVVIGFEVKEETVEAEARERAASLALSLDRQEQERKRREAEEAAIIEEKRRAREEQEKREREAEENMIAQKMEEVKEQKKQLVTEEIEKEEQKVPEEIKSEETFSHEERSEDVETETPSKSSNMPDSWPKESSSLKGSEIEANEGKEESKAELDNKKAEYDRLKRERSRTKSLSASSSRRPKKPSDHPAMILDSFGARSRNSSAPVVVTNRVTKPEYVIPYSPSLIYVDPKSKQKEFYRLCSETTNIGRKDDNDLPLVSQYVSRYHARIDCEQLNGETAIVFKDLNSYSGSRVNGEKLNQKVLLKGDQIKIGKTLLVFTGNYVLLVLCISDIRILDKSDKPLLSDVTKEGPGFKQSSKLLKPWQSRYFVYQGQVIFYFKSKKEVIGEQKKYVNRISCSDVIVHSYSAKQTCHLMECWI